MDKKNFCRPKDFRHFTLKWQDLAKKSEKKMGGENVTWATAVKLNQI